MAPPSFDSGHPAHDAAYAKAVRDVADSVSGGVFVAGESWPTVWVRDASFAIDLATALTHPTVSTATLRGVAGSGAAWPQDRAAHFGGWPRLTDSVVGAVGAWACYQATGDLDFLRWSHGVTRASLARAEREVTDGGLFRGCASFMESNSGYPPRFAFRGRAVGATKALSTNVLHHRGYVLAARAAALLGEDPEPFEAAAARLRQAINERLWQPDRGHYAYYEDADGRTSDRWEGLGNALAVLWGVADDDQAAAILRTVVPTRHGLPCLWPPYPLWKPWLVRDEYYYHNATVWPFVQGYWGWAAATRGAVEVFAAELAALAALAGRAPTYHEFYRPDSGAPDGSARQLWSAAGYLAMVHYGLLGLAPDGDELRFRPVVPAGFSRLRLSGLAYRNLTLEVTVTGSGTRVRSFALDDVARPDHAVPAALSGVHRVDIAMH
ncbi:MGH1-like glycoside hydrolase domain-containing protein [Actinophytocola xanthii]|uniref:MGH1-like glycoside hydrolase domain-containing protein n=1 Tax=Actinophytocola xanthii TaxID=1912961 RepID=UPI001177E35E|nr:glycosyl hydrolase family 65 protein [Actinophytocola xanthii]